MRDCAVVGEIAESLKVAREIAMYLVVLSLGAGEGKGEVSVFVGSRREERMRVGIEGLRAWDEWIDGQGNRSVRKEWMRRMGEEVGLR